MKHYALIGYPLSHSLSAIMHNYAFDKLNIKAEYKLLEIKPSELQNIRHYFENLSGANVTIPYKEAVIPFLDALDDSAQQSGAVNTIVKENGQLIGYNTDNYGFLEGLKNAQQLDKIKSNILILGAGGAAKAVANTLLLHGATQITVANRHLNRLTFSSKINYQLYSEITTLSDYDLIIQTTPVGMLHQSKDYPIDFTTIKASCCCYDLVYNPLITPFLQQSRQQGAITINGLPMLVFQGARAFELWTQQQFPIADVIALLIEKLKGELNVNR